MRARCNVSSGFVPKDTATDLAGSKTCFTTYLQPNTTEKHQ